jgi:hypothetical protein
LIVCWVAGLCLLAGCAGENLAKENFERTTVKAEPNGREGPVPSGPIDDPAFEPATLRKVDACALLGDELAATLLPNGQPTAADWGRCARTYVDVGGKPIRVMVELGESGTLASADDATGNVGGLPLVQHSSGDSSCISVAVTRRQPNAGVSVMATHDQGGGDPCDSSYVALEGVVEALRSNPAMMEEPEGSLMTVDLCESFSSEHVSKALELDEEPRINPSGLHFCQLSFDDVIAYAHARVGYPVTPGDEAEEIELVDGLKVARQASGNDIAECDVSWVHLPISEQEAELMTLSYYDYGESADTDTACSRVTDLAKGLLKTLP